MKPRSYSKLALPLIFALLATASASAQDKKGSNLSDTATVPGSATPAEQLVLGYRLADYARTMKDARAMTVAARIVDGVPVKESADKGKLEGKRGSKGARTGPAKTVSAGDLFAEARQFAAGDTAILAEIEAAQAEASRGALGAGGAIALSQYVPGQSTWTVRFAARGGEPLVIAAQRDTATSVDLKIFDENGNLVCQDMAHNVTMYCRINPIWAGPFSAQAINHGEIGTSMRMVTN
jgi:hypothetical protein